MSSIYIFLWLRKCFVSQIKSGPKASSHKVKQLVHPFINSHKVHFKIFHLSEYLSIMPYFKPH